MTKEQIKQNAEEYAVTNDICVCGEDYWAYHDLLNAHIAGAESRQPEIDKACELIKELVKLYHVNMPYYNNIVVWKSENFLKEQGK